MKRIVLSSTFLIACLIPCLFGACSSEADVTCDIVWSANDDTELGTGTIVYPELDDADAGVDMCKTDQETHEDRPTDAVKYTCNCST